MPGCSVVVVELGVGSDDSTAQAHNIMLSVVL
jgi:hypothetical protein